MSSRCVGDERNFPPLPLPLLLPAVLVLDLKLAVPNILLPEAIERTMASPFHAQKPTAAVQEVHT